MFEIDQISDGEWLISRQKKTPEVSFRGSLRT